MTVRGAEGFHRTHGLGIEDIWKGLYRSALLLARVGGGIQLSVVRVTSAYMLAR